MLNNDVTELVVETILPLCDKEELLGKESLDMVRFWFFAPNDLNDFFVDLWQLGVVECLLFFKGSLFVGFSHKELDRFNTEGQLNASRIRQRIKAFGSSEGVYS